MSEAGDGAARAQMQLSPDITAGHMKPQVQYKISEAQCERAVFIWELDLSTFPAPVIPSKEDSGDVSVCLTDLVEKIPSGRFIRGQEISKPAEWQIFLQNTPRANPEDESELEIAVSCEKIYIQAFAPVLAKVAVEIIDDDGGAIWKSEDLYESKLKTFLEKTVEVVSLGTKAQLEEKQAEMTQNGTLRFRLRLNIYKDLSQTANQTNANENSGNGKPPLKRRRIEGETPLGLTDLLGSLESFWEHREQTGDVTIICGEQEIKAHRFILSGRSRVFLEMLNSSKMETLEKTSSVIKIDDTTPEIVETMLEFLYLSSTNKFETTNVDHVCALIYVAEKYWIKPLLNKCYQYLMKIMNLENFAKVAKAAFMYNCDKQFKDEVRHFFESHQITLNDVESFRKFAYEDFDYFYRLFFYVP